MTPKHGEFALVPIPFTDLTAHRKRPVIVVSNDSYHHSTQDFVCVAMTSNLTPSAYSFDITSNDLIQGTLNRTGRIRADKIYTLSQKLIVNIFGGVQPVILDRIRKIIADLCK